MLVELVDYFESLDPVLAAFYATLFTWLLTALGAALVFFFKGMNRALFDGLLGFTESRLPFHSFFVVIEIAEDKEQLKLNFMSRHHNFSRFGI